MHTDQGSDHMTSHPPMKVSVINIYENRFIQYTCIPHYIGPGSSTCMCRESMLLRLHHRSNHSTDLKR